MKRTICLVMMVILILLIGMPAMASEVEMDKDSWLGVDYTAELIKVLDDGSEYALHAGTIFERLRNEKIEALDWEDKYEKTYWFQNGDDYETIYNNFYGLNEEPEPTPAPTVKPTPVPTSTPVTVDSEQDILAKLLYCEAGSMGWQGQVYVCSAILNLRDYSGRSIWNMAHDYNTFAVAGYVDSASPTSTQYEVISYVLNGGRIPDIKYFRTNYYHSFGTPVCNVENVYFSK